MTALDTEEILWEEISCPLCSNGDEDLLLAVPADPAETLYRLVRCRHCGMVYVNPRPQAVVSYQLPVVSEGAATSSLTTGNWQPVTACRLWLERLVLSCYHGYPPARTQWWEKLLAFLARPLVRLSPASLMPLPYVGEGRLMQCSGEALVNSSASPREGLGQRLQHRGWNVLTREGRPEGKRTFSLQAPPSSLDAIVLEGVLGHVHWPHPLIEQAARALRPGGLLAVCVPNLDSWGFRTFGMRWHPLDVPRQLLHFTPATLQRLVTMHGLEVTELRYTGTSRSMRRTLQNQYLPGLFAGVLTRWTVWRKQADSLLLLARRPRTCAAVRLAA